MIGRGLVMVSEVKELAQTGRGSLPADCLSCAGERQDQLVVQSVSGHGTSQESHCSTTSLLGGARLGCDTVLVQLLHLSLTAPFIVSGAL